VLAGQQDERVVVLCADLAESTRSDLFKAAFPERYVTLGVAEQALAGVAAGMALQGQVAFIASYAAFSPGRNWEQIRTLACLQGANVKVIGCHAGVSVGPDGATHQMTEDLALMRVLPNMVVLVPGDYEEAKKAVLAAVEHEGPVYIRLGREVTPVFTTKNTPFKIGEALVLTKGTDVALVSCGALTFETLKAAALLEKQGVNAMVIHSPSVKPLDEGTILKAAKICGAMVSVEEAQIAGGLGGAIAEYLSQNKPIPLERVGLMDEFGQSGTPQELLEHYRLTAPHIAKAALRAIRRAKNPA
jgi:transketolase